MNDAGSKDVIYPVMFNPSCLGFAFARMSEANSGEPTSIHVQKLASIFSFLRTCTAVTELLAKFTIEGPKRTHKNNIYIENTRNETQRK